MSHQPDEVVAKQDGNFQPHAEGQHAVLCVDVVNLGVNVEQYLDNPPREVAKVALVFASGERHTVEKTGERFLALITVEMALSASDRANLRKFLESWRGKTYTAEQAEAGLPVTKLYSQPALISVEHVTTRKGRKFAKIVSIGPLPKAMPVPDTSLLTEYQRPSFFDERKKQYAAALATHRVKAGDSVPTAEYPGGEDDDDLPF
jgi:hypothetical protein